MTREHESLWRNKRVRTPTVLQMEEVECGAAALGIVLAHHGLVVPLDELRVQCGIGRDGCRASNLVKAAHDYGLLAKGYRVELEALRQLPLPMILLWHPRHFLVLEGIAGGKVYLNDPKTGQRVVSMEELDERFTGFAMAFRRGPDFKPGGCEPNLLTALRQRLVGFRKQLLWAVVSSLLLIIPGLLVPVFSKSFVDRVLMRRMEGALGPLLIGLAATAAARCILNWFQGRCLLGLEIGLAVRTSRDFLRHVLSLPIPFFSQRMCGEIANRVGINDRVAHLLSRDLAAHAINLTLVFFYVALMFYYDVELTLIGLGAAAVHFVALAVVSNKRSSLNQRLLRERGNLVGKTVSGIHAVESLKATGREPEFLAEWMGQQSLVVQADQEMSVATESLAVVPFFLSLATGVAILAIGSFRVMAADLTVGTLVAFQSLMASFLGPVGGLVGLGAKLQEVRGDMIRLDDVLRYPVERHLATDTRGVGPGEGAPERQQAGLRDRFRGRLDVRNVDFSFARMDPPFIRRFSLRVRPGGHIALVGRTGSGKSTIAKLLTGLYWPCSGEILYDGVPLDLDSREWLATSLSLVPQEICLFEGTVRNNLTLWDDNVSEADLVRAAKDACIYDEIMSRPGGFESHVENAGGNFSGGQRQRLQIARALIMNPSLLLLDEATSSLDRQTEDTVREAILRRGCSTITIAHRLESVRDCQEIVVLERGKVVQRGTHADMIAFDGPYARLFAQQASAGAGNGRAEEARS